MEGTWAFSLMIKIPTAHVGVSLSSSPNSNSNFPLMYTLGGSEWLDPWQPYEETQVKFLAPGFSLSPALVIVDIWRLNQCGWEPSG